jgi:hypothetical protein
LSCFPAELGAEVFFFTEVILLNPCLTRVIP